MNLDRRFHFSLLKLQRSMQTSQSAPLNPHQSTCAYLKLKEILLSLSSFFSPLSLSLSDNKKHKGRAREGERRQFSCTRGEREKKTQRMYDVRERERMRREGVRERVKWRRGCLPSRLPEIELFPAMREREISSSSLTLIDVHVEEKWEEIARKIPIAWEK